MIRVSDSRIPPSLGGVGETDKRHLKWKDIASKQCQEGHQSNYAINVANIAKHAPNSTEITCKQGKISANVADKDKESTKNTFQNEFWMHYMKITH